MVDVVEKNGDRINVNKMSKALGCEIVQISALKRTGIMEAVSKAVKLTRSKETNISASRFTMEVENIINEVKDKLENDINEEQKRFFAIKLLEKDDKIVDMLKNSPDISKEIKQMEEIFDDDTESIITNERYTFISYVIEQCVVKNKKNKVTISEKIDQIVTNRWLALPIFAVVMFLVYYISVTTVGTWANDWANDCVVYFSCFFGSMRLYGKSSIYYG